MSPARLPLLPVVVLLLLAGCGPSDDAPERPARLHAAPVTPDIVATRGERQNEYSQREVMLLNKWVKRAAISAPTTVTLFELVKQSRGQKTTTGWIYSPDQLVATLQSVIKGASTRDSGTQAAAYLVGDRVLRLAWRPFRLHLIGQKPQRDLLKELGAESFLVEASGETEYAGDWLRTAIHLDPHGPIGQRAVLLEIESDCASGTSTDNYHSFIERLDAVVTAPADSEVKSTAQILEADAYRDMYVLALGFGKDKADSTKFLPEAEVAKVKAIALYEAALTTDSTSRLARGGKLAHDRLVSGQPPDHTRFFCLGE